MTDAYEHDIAISYAGEDVDLAARLASKLSKAGVSVFFPPTQQAALLGERLEEVLPRKYGPSSRFVVVLLTEHYPIKDWTRFELDAARAEEEARKEAFILPLLHAEAAIDQIPPDKVFLDLRVNDLDQAVAMVAERVKQHRGAISPRAVLEDAFVQWNADRFIPGTAKADLWWAHIDDLDLDIDRCELLLRCPSSNGELFRRAVARIDSAILGPAAERLIASAESPNLELAAIGYLGLADPDKAEAHLWRIYEDVRMSVHDRARAFERFWLCPSLRSRQEPKKVLVDRERPWPLRRAAAIDLLWSEHDDDTEKLLAAGLKDPRSEVRSKILDAILRFELSHLAPDLMEAYERDRSRKGKAEIKRALRHFNDRPDVVAFGRRQRFGPAFFKAPVYVHDWEKAREGWV